MVRLHSRRARGSQTEPLSRQLLLCIYMTSAGCNPGRLTFFVA